MAHTGTQKSADLRLALPNPALIPKPPLWKEMVQIVCASALSGPLTWPLAATLLAKQRGLSSYSFSKYTKANGLRFAYAGCLPYSAYKVFGIGTQRGVQAPMLLYLNENYSDWNIWSRYVLAGIVSGVIGGVLVTPIEQIKISLANQNYRNLSDASRFYRSHGQWGARALMAGAKVTVCRNILFDAVNSVLYNAGMGQAVVDRANSLHVAGVNAVAGVLTAVIDYPLDVLKTRIQSSAGKYYADVGTLVSIEVALGRGAGAVSSGVGSSASCAAATASSTLMHAQHRSMVSVLGVARDMVRREGVGSLYGGLREKLGLYFLVWFVYGLGFSAVGKMLNCVS